MEKHPAWKRITKRDGIMLDSPLILTRYTLVNALGLGVDASLRALRESCSGLRPNDYAPAPLPTWIGRVDAIERTPLAESYMAYEGRNNRLARLTLEQDGFASAVAEAKIR